MSKENIYSHFLHLGGTQQGSDTGINWRTGEHSPETTQSTYFLSYTLIHRQTHARTGWHLCIHIHIKTLWGRRDGEQDGLKRDMASTVTPLDRIPVLNTASIHVSTETQLVRAVASQSHSMLPAHYADYMYDYGVWPANTRSCLRDHFKGLDVYASEHF